MREGDEARHGRIITRRNRGVEKKNWRDVGLKYRPMTAVGDGVSN